MDHIKQEITNAKGLSRGYLEDHLVEVLRELAEFLKSDGSKRDYLESTWLATKHGIQRAESEKYTISDIRNEYRILNEIIFSFLPKNCYLTPRSQQLYSEIFQMVVSQSTETFIRNSAHELLKIRSEKHEAASNLERTEGHLAQVISERDLSHELQYWLHLVIDKIPKPLFFLNLEKQNLWFSNEAARKMLGLNYEDEMDTASVLGKLEIFTADGKAVVPHDFPSRRALRGERIEAEELILRTLTGKFHVRVFAEQLPAAFGQPASAIILIQDVTTLKAVEQDLRKAQVELGEAIEIAQIGFWSVDLPSYHLNVTPLFLKQMGMRPDELAGSFETAFNRIDVRDRDKVASGVQNCIQNRVPYDIEYRINHPDGAIRWIQAKGNTFYDLRGNPTRFAGTTLDITESVKAREELEFAKKTAETANQTKSQFLANMSHEIRTPLGAIMGFASLLRDHSIGTDQADGFISVIERNSNQLLRIIDDILDLSKVEAGMLQIENITFSLPELITDFSSIMGFKAREKGIGFSSKASTKLPLMINSDPTRIRQILMNVVGNAIKFTERGSVEMICSFAEGLLTFEIKDTGRGISPDESANLFQPFAQADPTITRKYGGTGLGLVLTRSLAEALGGKFELKTSQLEQGSTFVVSIKVDVVENSEFVSGLGFESVAATPSMPIGELANCKVLLVEDSPDNQALISIFLTRAGARVDIASDGAQGSKMALENQYDIVLMDVQMPVMDGITAMGTLRSAGYDRPVIALTAHAMKEERDRCLSAGFSNFLSKPVVRADLIEMLTQYKKQFKH